MLGFAQKAGKLKTGGNTCKKIIKSGKARMVIIASDTEQGTLEQYKNWCKTAGITYYPIGTKRELGSCIGKSERSIIAVMDFNLAKSIEKAIMN